MKTDMEPVVTAKWRWLRWPSTEYSVGVLLLLLVTLFFYPQVVITVEPGHAGVLWDRFFGGTQVGVVYGEGMHLIMPWNRFYKYDVRLQSITRDYDAFSQSGLLVKVNASVRFRPAGAPFDHAVNRGAAGENSLAELHKRIGPDYAEKVVIPVVAEVLRQVVGKYGDEELYKSKHETIQDKVIDVIADRRHNEGFADERLVDIIDVPIRTITLPEKVRAAIESKLAQEQQVLEYDFILRKEQKEATRKVIEAEGIKKFQDLVTSGLTSGYLQYRAIEATEKLAESPNAKLVVMGGKDGLPVILNMPEGAAAASAPRAGANARSGAGGSDRAGAVGAGPPPSASTTSPPQDANTPPAKNPPAPNTPAKKK